MPETLEHVGHIAPDPFSTPFHFNTLVVRPTYRIQVRLGEIEELFPDDPGSPRGKMARLQVLGLFYFPLGHAKAEERLNTKNTNPNIDAWAWARDKVLGAQDDIAAQDLIQQAFRKRVVSEAHAPMSALAALREGLPPPGDFAKIRLPGGYAFLHDAWTPENPNKDPKYQGSFDMPDPLNKAEDLHYKDNPVLGRIPIVAKVERRVGQGDVWEAAPNVAVYFQLIPPDPLPSFDPAKPMEGQIVTPPSTRPSIDALVVASEDVKPDPMDPQGKNCHKDRGGKRGAPVAGNLFVTKSVPGFNQPHAARKLARLHYFSPAAPPQDPKRHPHAVKAITNSDGEAGLILAPSRTAGDRYRIRAYVGPPSLESDGSEPIAVRAETGTLVVWRNIRISRYVRKDVPQGAPLDPAMMAEFQGWAPYHDQWNVTHSLTDPNCLLWLAALMDSSKTQHQHTWKGLSDLHWRGLQERFARAWCELESDGIPIDPATGFLTPEIMSEADYVQAFEIGRNDADAASSGGKLSNKNYNIFDLYVDEVSDNDGVIDNMIALHPMHTLTQFNAAAAALGFQQATNQVDRDNLENLWWGGMVPGFMRYFTADGALPGLTIIQGGAGCSHQLYGDVDANSGVATPHRGCYLFFGAETYASPGPTTMAYDYTSNVSHELGHCLFREHAPGVDLRDPGPPPVYSGEGGGANPSEHDKIDSKAEPLTGPICVMSYKHSGGEFCSKCLLALRGWKVG